MTYTWIQDKTFVAATSSEAAGLATATCSGIPRHCGALSMDGDVATEWRCNTPGPCWMQFNLGSLRGVGAIAVVASEMQFKSATLQWSATGVGGWSDVKAFEMTPSAIYATRVDFVVQWARYWRLNVDATDSPPGVVDFFFGVGEPQRVPLPPPAVYDDDGTTGRIRHRHLSGLCPPGYENYGSAYCCPDPDNNVCTAGWWNPDCTCHSEDKRTDSPTGTPITRAPTAAPSYGPTPNPPVCASGGANSELVFARSTTGRGHRMELIIFAAA